MIIAGTGHRPNKLGGYSKQASRRIYDVAKHYLDTMEPDGVISGLALGWDMELAEAALDLCIPLTCAIPFAGQESRWPKESQDRWNKIVKHATYTHIVSEGGYAPWKMQTRNIWMVDNCDLVLALWDGSDGGTGNCIKYANKIDKPIVNLWDKYNGTGN